MKEENLKAGRAMATKRIDDQSFVGAIRVSCYVVCLVHIKYIETLHNRQMKLVIAICVSVLLFWLTDMLGDISDSQVLF